MTVIQPFIQVVYRTLHRRAAYAASFVAFAAILAWSLTWGWNELLRNAVDRDLMAWERSGSIDVRVAVTNNGSGKDSKRRDLGGDYYRFLRNRFADTEWSREQNKVFLFGFSRGAYTARRIGGLIAHSGIPVRSSDTHLGFELYRQRDTETAAALKAAANLRFVCL